VNKYIVFTLLLISMMPLSMELSGATTAVPTSPQEATTDDISDNVLPDDTVVTPTTGTDYGSDNFQTQDFITNADADGSETATTGAFDFGIDTSSDSISFEQDTSSASVNNSIDTIAAENSSLIQGQNHRY